MQTTTEAEPLTRTYRTVIAPRLAAAIRVAQRHKGITNSDIARACGLSLNRVAPWLDNGVALRVEHLAVMLEVLGFDSPEALAAWAAKVEAAAGSDKAKR